MYCRDLGFEGKVVLQYWLLGVGLCHNTVHCIVTEARQGLYCNTVTVPTIQQGHGCWACRWALGERACWACRARARLGVLGAGAAGAGARRASGSAERWPARGRASGRRGRAGQAAAGARLGGRALGAGRTGRWAQARGACVAGAGSVHDIGRQGARLGAPGALAGPVWGSCSQFGF